MRTLMLGFSFLLLGCASEDPRNPPLQHSASGGGNASSSSGGPKDAGCDAFADEGCCVKSDLCKDTACMVAAELCDGVCVGQPNPNPDTKCGVKGMCVGTECVEPEPSDAGCDAFIDENCCVTSPLCKDTACEVAMKLCGGECHGQPNPVQNAPCGDGGTCQGTECAP